VLRDLQNLIHLDLGQNQIRRLPDDLQGFVALRVLDLSHNQLTRLPVWVETLPDLQGISLTGNMFEPDAFEQIQRWKERARYGLIDMPRLHKKPSQPRPASQLRLSQKVISQIERLGGTFRTLAAEEQKIVIAGATYTLPEALRQLIFDVQWPEGEFRWSKYDDDYKESITFGIQEEAIEEYECSHNQPLIVFAENQHHCYYLFNLETEHTEDPDIYYIDHDSFWDLEASHQNIRLSKFLSSFQKPTESGK
jgi:hypothetical protein